MVFVAGLVIVLLDIFLFLIQSPSLAVAFELHALIDRERWNTHTCQAEMIGTVEVAGFRTGVRTDRKAEILGDGFDGGIEGSSLRAGNLNFFRRTERLDIVVVEVKSDFPGGNWRMLS